MQCRRRMIDRENRDLWSELEWLPMSLRDGLLRKEMAERVTAECDDDLRFDQRDLQHQPRHALLLFDRLRVAIAGGPELHDIRDIDLFAPEADRSEQFIEKFPRRADERPTQLIFLLPGCFADEHDFCMRIAFAENGICGLREITALPDRQFFFEEIEGECGHDGIVA